VVLLREDLLIDTAQMEGYVTEEDSHRTVVLDTNLSEGLIEEGFVREIISKIQTMRKEAGFEVMDRIYVYSSGNDRIADYMKRYHEEIQRDVMATDIQFETVKGYVKEWNINGESVTLGVEKQ
jgi:isoleucyl-tRNA synthetase